MPNISLKFVDAYRDRMQLIQQAAHDEMQLYINQYGIEDGQALSEAAQGIVTKYSTMATSAAANMYDDLANYQGAGVWEAETIETPTMKETQHAVFASLNGGTPDRASNAVESLVKQIGEDTILQNAVRDRAEYAWIPGGSETCAYCLDIASNGWQPARLDPAHGEHADHIHPNCKCHFMVRFSKEYDVEGYEPQKYKKILIDTPGKSLHEKSKALARNFYAENKDTINARKRELYAEKSDMMAKPGSPKPNDWSHTIPNNYSKDEIKSITEEIKNESIGYIDISKFDGNIELLKSSTNTLTELAKAYPIKKKTNLLVSELDDDDFGMTTSSGQTITINTKVLRNRKETEKNIRRL